jgi:hypothetical protein
MFQWLKNLFKTKPQITPNQVDDPVEWRRHIIAEVYNTGDCICGHIENGKVVIDWRKKSQ